MPEFGEQLRRAREAKGITQQSLAEKLYVTRQTVSRWEGGERYPDLLTVKKLSQVLEVDVGDLLSDEEPSQILERSPLTERKMTNRLTVLLFTAIITCYLISLLGILIRFPNLDLSLWDLCRLGVHFLSILIGMAGFSAGLLWLLRGSLSAKKVGVVMLTFFLPAFMKNLMTAVSAVGQANWLTALFPALVCAAAAVSAYFYFWNTSASNACYWLLLIVCALGICRALYTFAVNTLYAREYLSAETALNAVINICIYSLFCFQSRTLYIRKRIAN